MEVSYSITIYHTEGHRQYLSSNDSNAVDPIGLISKHSIEQENYLHCGNAISTSHITEHILSFVERLSSFWRLLIFV